jgi:hypothetical protein
MKNYPSFPGISVGKRSTISAPTVLMVMGVVYMSHLIACVWFWLGDGVQVVSSSLTLYGWRHHLVDHHGLSWDADVRTQRLDRTFTFPCRRVHFPGAILFISEPHIQRKSVAFGTHVFRITLSLSHLALCGFDFMVVAWYF